MDPLRGLVIHVSLIIMHCMIQLTFVKVKTLNPVLCNLYARLSFSFIWATADSCPKLEPVCFLKQMVSPRTKNSISPFCHLFRCVGWDHLQIWIQLLTRVVIHVLMHWLKQLPMAKWNIDPISIFYGPSWDLKKKMYSCFWYVA